MEDRNDQEKISNGSKFEKILIMSNNGQISLAKELRHMINNFYEVRGNLDGQPCLLLCDKNICVYTDNVVCLPSDTLKLIWQII